MSCQQAVLSQPPILKSAERARWGAVVSCCANCAGQPGSLCSHNRGVVTSRGNIRRVDFDG